MASLDVIIPVYNEEGSIEALCQRIHAALHSAGISYSLIFVDDNSSDGTVSIIRKVSKKYPISLYTKQGEKGKAYSILEGMDYVTADFVCMIDGDLQYPPEAIPQLFEIAQEKGVAVAKRISYEGSVLRRIGSRALCFLFGKLLHGIGTDMQSGLKVFKRDIVDFLDADEITPWSFDLPLLHAAKQMGYEIGEVEIEFRPREHGNSKLTLLGPTFAIAKGAVRLKIKHTPPRSIDPLDQKSMLGAGVVHKGKRFITHTTLKHTHSAIQTLTPAQRTLVFSLIAVVLVGICLNILLTLQIAVAILSFIYFVDVIFNFFLIIKSLHSPPEISPSDEEIAQLVEKDLPIYTILCPLYKESHVIPQFLEAIEKLDWPKTKLDVQLLLEADDTESIDVVGAMKLPSYVRMMVVPDSQPKTKPKACNFGLNHAKGEYLVIYDAEDSPDPLQLKKAYLGFAKVGKNVKCLQAKLNYYNPHQNWLTRFFTAEYSLWFDVILTGLQSIRTTIPLGGTSNHFRVNDLVSLQGWDPFNVTEDCDLGIRLFKSGYQTAIIDSTTLEEANSNPKNWIRQRSRWIKGYMQTYLLHMRNPIEFGKKQGIHALFFQLTIGGKLAFILINPILWLLTISYFTLHTIVGPTIEALYPSIVFYMAVTSLIFGNFMYIYYYMIGCAKREQWTLMKWVYLIPFYWLMVSVAACMALYQLIVKPHYWEKTIHGLHLKKKTTEVTKEAVAEIIGQTQHQQFFWTVPPFAFPKKLLATVKQTRQRMQHLSMQRALQLIFRPENMGGMVFLVANLAANLLNMATNIYLGRSLTLSQFGVFNLVVSILYLVTIPVGAFGQTVNYKASFLMGKFSEKSLRFFWGYMRKRAAFVACVVCGVWLLLSGWITSLFHLESSSPVLSVSILLFVSILSAVDIAYLSAKLDFFKVAMVVFFQPLLRFVAAIALSMFLPEYAFFAVVIGMGIATVFSTVLAGKGEDTFDKKYEFHLPRMFFLAALISGFSMIAFFSLDNIIVGYILGPEELGKYGVLGLVGKMIFFVGSLASSFLSPLVARAEGAGTNSRKIFLYTFLTVAALSLIGYTVFALGVYAVGPYFFGEKIAGIREYLPIYGVGIALFTVAQVIVSYHLLKKHYLFSIVSLILAGAQVALMLLVPKTFQEIVWLMTGVGVVHFVSFGLLHLTHARVRLWTANIRDFLDLFGRIPVYTQPRQAEAKMRILILNWRDCKHRMAGGAEEYVEQIAREFVALGHQVTLFAGNDGHSTRNQIVEGVQIIRRGGFYTVYVWAFLYYVFRFRGHYDVIIDSQNGVPFLTPLYARIPVFLLIHHVHQEVFREHLKFPLKQIALFIEGELMPLLYRSHSVVTVSDSSRNEILKLGLGNPESISVIHPGITRFAPATFTKTTYPSFCYVGRLKFYKNIDIALKAFARIHAQHPAAKFSIAGTGEARESLEALVHELHIENAVVFHGFVEDSEKQAILSISWAALQPSMIEGWGITVIEANACSTPVIASNVKGLRDSVVDRKTGILVPPKNIHEFTAAMEHIIRNKKMREELAIKAYEWSQEYNWRKSASSFIEIMIARLGNKKTFQVPAVVPNSYEEQQQ